jgi:DNA processing protein
MVGVRRRSFLRRGRMKKNPSLGFPRKLSLFRTLFDDQIGDLAGAEGSDEVLRLALARMDFLRCHEKLLLARAVGSIEELEELSVPKAQAIILRELRPEFWQPRCYHEKALVDREFLASKGIRFVAIGDRDYPPQLREVFRPPFGLYLRGRLPNPERPAVAIVGTRIPTGRGLQAAYRLAASLSASGICVVSGLARGIDAAAHRGALKGEGKTVAVLPAGIDSIYPPSNRNLAAMIIDLGGALLTEYPPFVGVQRYRFPERNRIIAGLARSCVVVEAPAGSGALITADHALTEGRDVFVHGDCIGSVRNSGAEILASQGAGIVNNAGDIFGEWRATAESRRIDTISK